MSQLEVISLQQALEEHSEVVIRTAGTSMKPLLHAQQSTVLVRKADRPCRKNDVALYIRPDGRYVLHRVVKAGNPLLMRGDFQLSIESVNEESVIGLMVGFHVHPNSPFCSVKSLKYTAYLFCLPAIRLYLKLRALPGQLSRKWEEMFK